MPQLFGSVAMAVRTAPMTVSVSVSVSYTGATTLTFTATTDQLLDGGGLWVEIFEKTMPGGIQYLGGCNSRTTSLKGPAVPRTFAGHVCRHFGVHQQHVPAGRLGREFQTGDTPALGICLAASGATTTNTSCPCPVTKWSEIFDRTKESGETRQDR